MVDDYPAQTQRDGPSVGAQPRRYTVAIAMGKQRRRPNQTSLWVSRISCPRMTFAGREDVVETPNVIARIGPLIAQHQEELDRMGWRVHLVDGLKHELGFRPDIVMPLLRNFFGSHSSPGVTTSVAS